MKIVFATSSFHGGGITSYAMEVINNYSTENDFYVIVGDDSQSPIRKDNVHVVYCESTDVSFRNAQYIIHQINECIKPDVIINSNSRLISLVAPFLLDSIKVITVSHSLKYIETDISAITNRFTDTIIALSYFNKKYIDNRFHIKDVSKTTVVYNFVADGNNIDDILQTKKAEKTLNIVFLGGNSGSKAPELAFKSLKGLLNTELDFHFYWLGDNTPTFSKIQPFKSISALLPQDSRITLTGRIPRTEVEELCKKANVILIPSRREGCPMSLLETMRYGIITVTSDYKNACREIIKDGYNGFIIPHNKINRFVEIMSDIILNHKKYLSYYDNSIATFKEELCFKVWKEKMDKIIYSDPVNHQIRRRKFSKIYYTWIRSKLEILDWQNRLHKFLFETLPSAKVFLCEYYKKR